MIQSMTGFGKSNGVYHSKKVSVEVRSLNSKGLDLTLKIPSAYRELDSEIRKMVAEKLDRGKIDLGIYIESSGDASNGLINKELASHYYRELKALNDSWNEPPVDYLSLVVRMPEVLNQQSFELDQHERSFMLDLMAESLEKLNEFRKQEGEALRIEFTKRIAEIRDLLLEIPNFEKERVQTIRERIAKGIAEIEGLNVDDNRMEQEMIFYIEKFDISEEKMRLNNHLDYFIETLNIPRSGKKLGFIAQEIGREINTLGSKSNHSEMQKRVVEMKDALEKIK
ncbi:MAG: YicC/YloC family endoribonuclease, partial [Crocinitomicaceae bacterium]